MTDRVLRQHLAVRVADLAICDLYLLRQRIQQLDTTTLRFLLGESPAPAPVHTSPPANPGFRDLNAEEQPGWPSEPSSPSTPPEIMQAQRAAEAEAAAAARFARQTQPADVAPNKTASLHRVLALQHAVNTRVGGETMEHAVERAAILLDFLDTGKAPPSPPADTGANAVTRIRRLKEMLRVTGSRMDEISQRLAPPHSDVIQLVLRDVRQTLAKDAEESPLQEDRALPALRQRLSRALEVLQVLTRAGPSLGLWKGDGWNGALRDAHALLESERARKD